MVIGLITKTRGITQESTTLMHYLQKKLTHRVLSQQAHDSILLAFEGIEIPNVSRSKLDCNIGVSFLEIKNATLKRKGKLLEALIVMEIENGIYNFSDDEMRIFSVVLACVIQ